MKSRICVTLLAGLVLSLAVWAGASDKDDKKPNPTKSNTNKEKVEPVRITKGPILEWIGAEDAVIAWSTNVRASSILRYGTEENHVAQMQEVPYGGPTHRVHLHNLRPDTRYYFVVDSGQGKGSGTEAKGHEESFTTVKKGEKGKKYSAAGPGM